MKWTCFLPRGRMIGKLVTWCQESKIGLDRWNSLLEDLTNSFSLDLFCLKKNGFHPQKHVFFGVVTTFKSVFGCFWCLRYQPFADSWNHFLELSLYVLGTLTRDDERSLIFWFEGFRSMGSTFFFQVVQCFQFVPTFSCERQLPS